MRQQQKSARIHSYIVVSNNKKLNNKCSPDLNKQNKPNGKKTQIKMSTK